MPYSTHRKMRRCFFIEGRLEADKILPEVFGSSEQFSKAVFCPKCGEVWARMPLYIGEQLQPWMVETVSCEGCNYLPMMHPGSLFRGTDHEFQDNFPKELYLREIDLAVKHFKRACEDEKV